MTEEKLDAQGQAPEPSQDNPEGTVRPEAASQEGRTVSIVGISECPMIYANTGAVMSTPFDIQIVLGDLVQADEQKVVAKAVARIIMTPEHAALLLKAITIRLDAYAKTYGHIRRLAVEIGPTETLR